MGSILSRREARGLWLLAVVLVAFTAAFAWPGLYQYEVLSATNSGVSAQAYIRVNRITGSVSVVASTFPQQQQSAATQQQSGLPPGAVPPQTAKSK